MEGYVTKKGKRIGSRVRRYMRLHGYELSNHHEKNGVATWRIDVRDAIVTANPRRHRLCLEIQRTRLDLFVESPAECDAWYEALSNAKSMARIEQYQQQAQLQLQAQKTDKRERDHDRNSDHGQVVCQQDGQINANMFAKGFKVIKPMPNVNVRSNNNQRKIIDSNNHYGVETKSNNTAVSMQGKRKESESSDSADDDGSNEENHHDDDYYDDDGNENWERDERAISFRSDVYIKNNNLKNHNLNTIDESNDENNNFNHNKATISDSNSINNSTDKTRTISHRPTSYTTSLSIASSTSSSQHNKRVQSRTKHLDSGSADIYSGSNHTDNTDAPYEETPASMIFKQFKYPFS